MTQQHSLMDKERRMIADKDKTFNEIMTGPNPLTREEIKRLIEKNPRTWGRYSNWAKED